MARKTDAVVDKIISEARGVYDRISRRQKPQMRLPIRSLSNVKYRPKAGYFQLSGKSKVRTMTVSTVRTFAQTLKMMAMSKALSNAYSGYPPVVYYRGTTDTVNSQGNQRYLYKQQLATLKSIRRHSERLVRGKAIPSSPEVSKLVRQYNAPISPRLRGTCFHNINFYYAKQARGGGYLLNTYINNFRILTPLWSDASYRVLDYTLPYETTYTFDLKPWRGVPYAYDQTPQFQDVFNKTGTMPVPLYYKGD
jgi:hypothetical protein